MFSDITGFYVVSEWGENGYEAPAEIVPGKGYYLFCLQAQTIQLTGAETESLQVNLAGGWSLIGGLNTVEQADTLLPDGYLLRTWDNTWVDSTTFDPCVGYWVYVPGLTQVNFP